MLVLSAVGVCGCSECEPSDFKCQGDTLYVCGGDERWERAQDCADIVGGGEWTCCETSDAGPECLPVEECGS